MREVRYDEREGGRAEERDEINLINFYCKKERERLRLIRGKKVIKNQKRKSLISKSFIFLLSLEVRRR